MPASVYPDIYTNAIRAEACRRSFKVFIEEFWEVVEPHNTLIWNWHLDVMVLHLELLRIGEILKLIMNISPRLLKSTILVLFNAWVWIDEPYSKWIGGSYDKNLSIRDLMRVKAIVTSDKFRAYFGEDCCELSQEQNTKVKVETLKGGSRLATSVNSMITGEGGDYLVLDDPHNVNEKDSKEEMNKAIEWHRTSFYNRANNPMTVRRIICCHRIAENDLTGDIWSKKDYHRVVLPMEYAGKKKICSHSTDPRTKEGEILFEKMFSKDVLEEYKTELRMPSFSAQYNQNPISEEGTLFKQRWIRYYKEEERAEIPYYKVEGKERNTYHKVSDLQRMAFMDLAISKGADADFTVLAVVDVSKSGYIFINEIYRGRMSAVEQIELAEQVFRRHNLGWLGIESVAYQTALIHILRERGYAIKALKPDRNKATRIGALSVYYENGKVIHKHKANYLHDYELELLSYTVDGRHKHDDQIDAMAYAQDYSMGYNKGGRVLVGTY